MKRQGTKLFRPPMLVFTLGVLVTSRPGKGCRVVCQRGCGERACYKLTRLKPRRLVGAELFDFSAERAPPPRRGRDREHHRHGDEHIGARAAGRPCRFFSLSSVVRQGPNANALALPQEQSMPAPTITIRPHRVGAERLNSGSPAHRSRAWSATATTADADRARSKRLPTQGRFKTPMAARLTSSTARTASNARGERSSCRT